jgi:dolichol-phosphate mannosyltransferase
MLTYVMIPTYQEAENIRELVQEIRREAPEAQILVVDDNSPDGTAAIVREIGRTDPRVQVMVRATDRGRGTAGRDGFKRALELGADRVVEMDADYSHHPRYLPAILAASKGADVVLGSRCVPGGGERGRPLHRRIVTRLAGRLLRLLLGVDVRDPSSGYRCFRREVLEAVDLDGLVSTGPAIVSELLYRARLKGFSITEVPILFEDRTRGTSKLTVSTLFHVLKTVLRLRRMHDHGSL